MFGVHPTLGATLRSHSTSPWHRCVRTHFLISGITRGEAGHPEWPFVIFEVIAIVSGVLGTTLVPRHYRTATQVVNTFEPTAQRILLELDSDSDSTSLYATPLEVGSGANKRRDRYALVLPIWNVESLLNERIADCCLRCFNPVNNRRVAFRTAKGML